MTSWDGTRWVADARPTEPPPRTGRLLGVAAEAMLITGLIFGLIAGTTLAAKGGNGPHAPAPAGCDVNEVTVSADGLPTGELINFMISDDRGRHGWVLGFTDDGTWSVSVPARTGSTVYEFVSRTFGPNGSKYRVFASCAAA